MAKISFPHRVKGEFSELAEAIKFIERESYSASRLALCDIVRYNSWYRTHLRRYGVESLIERLIEEAPQLKGERVLLSNLRRWAEEVTISDYDICCLKRGTDITLLGHKFKGLDDLLECVEMSAERDSDGIHFCSSMADFSVADIHVGLIKSSYPITYTHRGMCRDELNFVIRKEPITESDLRLALGIEPEDGFRLVGESIPSQLLPMLYYDGVGDYIYLAKERG